MDYCDMQAAASSLLDLPHLSPIRRPRAGTLPGLSSLTAAAARDLQNHRPTPQGPDPTSFRLSASPSASPLRRLRLLSMSTTGSPEPYPTSISSRAASPVSTASSTIGKAPRSKPSSLNGTSSAAEIAAATPIPTPTVVPGKGKVFQCPFLNCNMVFTRSEHLARHSRKHTGEKPFQCIIPGCNRIFSRFDNMMQHTQTHQRDGKQSNISTIANASTRVRGRRSLSNKADTAPKFLCASEDSDPNARRLSQFCIQPSDLQNSTLILRPITSELVHAHHAEAKKARARANAKREHGDQLPRDDETASEMDVDDSSRPHSPVPTITVDEANDGHHPGSSPTSSRPADAHYHPRTAAARRSLSISSQATAPYTAAPAAQMYGSGSKGRRSNTLPSNSNRPPLKCLEPNPIADDVAPNPFHKKEQAHFDLDSARSLVPAIDTKVATQVSPAAAGFVTPPLSAHCLKHSRQQPQSKLRGRGSLSSSSYLPASAATSPSSPQQPQLQYYHHTQPQYHQVVRAAEHPTEATAKLYSPHTTYQPYHVAPQLHAAIPQYEAQYSPHGHYQPLIGGVAADPMEYYPQHRSNLRYPLTPGGR
ncbi:Up in starvation [Tieghemiomyces parasiticus]|uniref:Up in starvation n=1 Tax=Tieghemiomyces parasiticus TaxID=78921 RepID=A0A9W8E0X7_9FUNG|nr:Up in starvation [Tieghemiomyces parasiticus]